MTRVVQYTTINAGGLDIRKTYSKKLSVSGIEVLREKKDNTAKI